MDGQHATFGLDGVPRHRMRNDLYAFTRDPVGSRDLDGHGALRWCPGHLAQW
jgi:hypothetical protein